MNNIDPNMKKVFKDEFLTLNKCQLLVEDLHSTADELRNNYKKLLNDYRSLLQDAVKITTIGDINQKKLFEAYEKLEQQKTALYQLSIMDHLTQIHNRPYIMKVFEDTFAQSKRYQQIFSCILLDIDDFKAVNDNHGHPMGDQVLKETAQQIEGKLRETDKLGRYGGEEFLIILSSTSVLEAEQVAEKIRTTVEKTTIGTKELGVTISLGVCDSQTDAPKSYNDMLHKVDIALYEAKRSGKNRFVTYQKQFEL